MVYEFGPYTIDEDQFELRCKGSRVRTQPRAFDLLVFLVKHRHRVVTKRELLDVLWGGAIVSDAALRHTVKLARQALQQRGRAGDGHIQTVHGRGFRFVDRLDVPLSTTTTWGLRSKAS